LGRGASRGSGAGANWDLPFRMADRGEAHFVAVLADGGNNIESEGEGAPPVFQRNYRGGSFTHGAQKRSQLSMKRFLGGHRRLSYADLRIEGAPVPSDPTVKTSTSWRP
jgi:hypothetical protein